jgi:hypothetical protein
MIILLNAIFSKFLLDLPYYTYLQLNVKLEYIDIFLNITKKPAFRLGLFCFTLSLREKDRSEVILYVFKFV